MRGSRAATLFVIGVAVGTLVVSPAGAHVGDTVAHLWGDHLQALSTNLHHTRGQANDRFVEDSGLIAIAVPPGAWDIAATSSGTVERYSNVSRFERTSNGPLYLTGHVTLPVGLYGRSLKVRGFEVCYDATDTPTLIYMSLSIHHVASPPTKTTETFSDHTDREDSVCRAYRPNADHTLEPTDIITLGAGVSFPGAGAFDVSRATVYLAPGKERLAFPDDATPVG